MGHTAPHLDPLDLLTVNQVAALLKRSRRTLYREMEAGQLRYVTVGQFRRIPRSEIERIINDGNHNG